MRIAQAVLSLCTLLLVYQLGKELYDPKIGLIAAAGYCFYPSLLGTNNLLLSEGLFTFFFVAAMLLAVRLLRQPTFGGALGVGVCLALGALTRSILWLFSPLLCLLLLFAIQASWRKRILLSGTVLVSFLVVIFPWAWRNTQLHKTLVIIDVMGGRNVMMGNYEYTPLERSWATISDVTGEKSWHHVLAANTPGYSELTQGQIDKAAMKYGIKYFFSHPGVSIQRSVVKFFNFWQLERELVAGMMQGIFGEIPKLTILGLAIVICGSYALTIFLAIYGAWLLPPANRWAHLLLLFAIGFTCLIHTAAFAHSRYHLPLIPILLAYAAGALVNWKAIWSKAIDVVLWFGDSLLRAFDFRLGSRVRDGGPPPFWIVLRVWKTTWIGSNMPGICGIATQEGLNDIGPLLDAMLLALQHQASDVATHLYHSEDSVALGAVHLSFAADAQKPLEQNGLSAVVSGRSITRRN